MSSSFRSRVPAGMVDSGSASVASFITALLATWMFDPAGLGVYAVFFSAYIAGSFLPRNLILMPVEIASIQFPFEMRGPIVLRSLRIGLVPSLVGTLAIGLAALASLRVADGALLWPMIATAGLTTLVSPLRDHVRRMLHLAGRSWHAAVASLALLGTVVTLLVAILADLPIIEGIAPAWIPFGALAVGNLVSLVVAVALAVRGFPRTDIDLTFAGLTRSGKWLTLSGISVRGSAFAAAAIITNVVGAEILGYAEAARLAAQPLMVFGFGLDDVLSPHVMEAGHRKDPEIARPSVRLYFRLVALVGVAYLAVGSFDWVLNPMAHLVPLAYAVPGLAAISILAVVADIVTYPYRGQLMGGHRERPMALIDVNATASPILVALSAPLTASFSRPVGAIAQSVHQLAAFRRATKKMYVDSLADPAAASRTDPSRTT